MPESVNKSARSDSPESRIVLAWARHLPWLKLSVDGLLLRARVNGQRRTWKLGAASAHRIANVLSDQVLVAERFGTRAKNQMLKDGSSFVDATTIHLVDGPVLVHVEQRGPEEHEPSRAVPATDRLQPAGVRTVQAMLASSSKTGWTVRQLAETAAVSVGAAQRVLATLERADLLVTSSVRVDGGTRHVRDRGELLDWLSRQPAARPTPARWSAYLYGRNTRDVLERAADRLARESTGYALTGMAAALLEDLGPTSVPLVHFWIDRQDDLATVAEASGMPRRDTGPNIMLWSDSDRSATLRTESRHGVNVAPAPRVYLDLLDLARGPEVAKTYRRVRLGY